MFSKLLVVDCIITKKIYKMKKLLSLLILLSYCLLLLSQLLAAGPNIVSYQGKLNDQNGQPLNDTYSITFTIYDDPIGGSALWVENGQDRKA